MLRRRVSVAAPLFSSPVAAHASRRHRGPSATRVELKLKQASAVLGAAPKELQNLVQAGVFRPRRHGKAYYFSRDTLLQAKVVLCLKATLGASTRYLSRFVDVVSAIPGFTSSVPDVVCLIATVHTNEPPVKILIPLGELAKEINQRLPLADATKDLPRRRKRSRAAWKRQEAILGAVRGYRQGRSEPELAVVAEATQATM